jgi:hypothetical protein
MKTNQTLFALTAVAGSSVALAFAPARPQSRPTTDLALGIPKFFLPKGEGDEAAKTEGEEEEKIGLSGLFQLITAGAGAPFLGDYKGVDKETGNFMFSLEANVRIPCLCSCFPILCVRSLIVPNFLSSFPRTCAESRGRGGQLQADENALFRIWLVFSG